MDMSANFGPWLPPRLEALAELAFDLRWTWNHQADELWARVDAEIWERTRNPHLILAGLTRPRLAQLAADQTFVDELERVAEARRRYLDAPSWWTMQAPGLPRGIVYFSMEFGLSEALPLYAGGLGVLAGDMLKAASDLGVPITGVGLYYGQGCFHQQLDADGSQRALYAANDPAGLPLRLALGADGTPINVELNLPGRSLRLRVWWAEVGRVCLYLLDSNVLWNKVADRSITATLYPSDPEQRLLQEIVLGIGGWILVEQLGIAADVCHLNEGHAALAAVERARRHQLARGHSFREALWATRSGNVFTTHTPVAAGFDRFPSELVLRYARNYALSAGINEDAVLALGRDPDQVDDGFNMAWLAARCCGTINAVSRRHGETSRRIFAPLYPRWPLAELPIGHVTNGVHMPSWDAVESDRLWTGACGAGRWSGDTGSHGVSLGRCADEQIWDMRRSQRGRLVEFVRRRTLRQYQHGDRGFDALASAREQLDPELLTLGFARRFAEYKRPLLLLSDPDRLARLLLDARRPLQLIIAGKAHPDDPVGRAAVAEWVRFAEHPTLRARLVFVEDYDLQVAEQLVQGVDVWINTPREPWEACGTSGMKVLVNGGLNLSVLDGWWAEAWAPEVGWALPAGSDQVQAKALFAAIEQEIATEFYERDVDGLPRRWIERIRASLSRLTARFSANRMLLDYAERIYRPAVAAMRERAAGGADVVRTLAAQEARVRELWGRLYFASVKSEPADGRLVIIAELALGGLAVDEVEVQLYADASPSRPAGFAEPMRALGSGHGGTARFVLELPRGAEPRDYTPRALPRFDSARRPLEMELICWPD